MIRSWQLQEAKNKLSQVVDEALRDGPQIVTRHGVATVVILSYDAYRQMLAGQSKLTAFFRESPLVGYEVDFSRDESPARDETVS